MPIDRNVPPPGAGEIPEQPFRDNFTAIDKMVGTLPEDYSAVPPGTLLVVNDMSTGPTVATNGVEPIDAAGRQFAGFCPTPLGVANSISLKTADHLGRLLRCRNTSSIVLQLELNANPEAGVGESFSCSILRPPSAGSVQIASSTLTNATPNGHTRVAAGYVATVYVDAIGGTWYLWGGTSA